MSYVTFSPSLDGSILVVTRLYGDGVVLPADFAALSCHVPNHGADWRPASEQGLASRMAVTITPEKAGNFMHTHHRTGRRTLSTQHGHWSGKSTTISGAAPDAAGTGAIDLEAVMGFFEQRKLPNGPASNLGWTTSIPNTPSAAAIVERCRTGTPASSEPTEHWERAAAERR